MGSRASKEIECIARLNDLISLYEEVMDFLQKESLMSKEEARTIRSSADVAKMLHTSLATLSRNNKLQLLEYEWMVLPFERLKLTIVTDRMSREFSYGY